MLRIVEWLVLGLLALILGLILTVRLVGWNWANDLVAQQVSQAIGRDVTIAGDLDVDLSLNPLVRIEDIRVENVPWGRFPHMATIEVLSARIDLLALLQGRIVIPEIGIRQPIVHLAVSRRGRANWHFGPGQAPRPEETPQQGGSLSVMHRMAVRDGKITYRDYASGTNLQLGIARLKGYTDAARNEIALAGKGRLGQQLWRFALRAGSFRMLRAANKPYPVDLALALADTRVNVEGTLTQSLQLQDADLNISVEGQNLSLLSPFVAGPRPQLPRHQLAGHLTRAGKTWRLQDFRAAVGQSRLQGELAFVPRGERPLIKADLTSSLLRYEDFAKLAPPSKDKKPQPLDLSVLRAVDAAINFQGAEILTPVLAVRDVRMDARLDEGRLRIEPLALDVGGGRVLAKAVLDASPPPFEASLEARIEQVPLSKVDDRAAALDDLRGILNGRIAAYATGATAAQVADAQDPVPFIDSVRIDDSQLSYRAPGKNTRLQVTVDTRTVNGQKRLEIEGSGRWQGEDFDLALQSDPILELANAQTNRPYAIAGTAKVARAEVRIDGTLERPLAFQGIDLAVSASGSGTEWLSPFLGQSLPEIPAYELEARLQHQGTRWELAGLEARVGGSTLSGDTAVDVAGGKPYVKADLFSRTLNSDDFAVLFGASDDARAGTQEAEAEKAGQTKLSPLNLKALRSLNADIRLEAEQIIAPNLPVQALAVDVALHDGRLTTEPFRIGVGGGAVRGALVLDSTMPISGTLKARISEPVDLQGALEPFGIDTSLGVLDGRTELSFVGATAEQIAAVEPTLLSTIYSFSIKDTHFIYLEPESNTDLELTIATTTNAGGSEPIRVQSNGQYQGESFDLDIHAGSPLRLLDEEGLYPLEADVEIAKTSAELEGNIVQPLKLKGLNLRLALEGPNPNRLQELLGLPLPSLPPYEVQGELSRDGGIWRFEDFEGTTGDSDLAGDLAIHALREPRPLLVAELISRTLDLDDLAGLIGAPPDPDETASPQQERKATAEAKDPTVLPDDPMNLSALRAIDARVSYRGQEVLTTLPINGIRIRAKLEGGRLVLRPLNFSVGGGNITSRLALDASEHPVQAAIATEVSHVDLKRILRRFEIADASVGDIGGRARLKATGDSVAELAAALDGSLSLIMTGGRIDSLLVELAGLDVTESIVALVGSDDPVPIRCAFTDFQARDGQVDVETFVVDTTDTRFTGDGTMNLDEERVDLVIVPHPKDWSLFAFPTPLHVKGRFSNLQFYPEYSELLEQTAIAVVLGLVATPFGALIPLVETGTGHDAACQALLDESKQQQRLRQEQRLQEPDDEDSREPRVDFEELVQVR
jgi:uncharacterized protein involved in outer membrane biogenesis